ncbi:alpha-D-ribose 1-methylphosphonate 5-triphosphate diphosphatase [Roseomonas gilardii subsp. gilardii]|uniref:alpha-D-ribose 1-methylphosphonate 5-triphosphate diphosphatase n=1 Tax=Roseomonas gilardii TaxID=257708 RepID=UPI001FF7B79F|nr:alpha-D-ribose 1-methylphosphonate 5-triphosphate diphosphatase [Roseomonas gilardii]UPG71564.1 alpha-D-ribose 1-methylphosphonate 5-triphosphate diphosphatase [Roseomonas gilardii subsp. gilardii]
MPREQILTNATLVLPDRLLDGTILLRDGQIAEIAAGRSQVPGALDLEGDHLIPGIIDLHTDNLERQVLPRAGARWPSRSAMLSHDAQTAAAGVTTVFDALCVGDINPNGARHRTFLDGVADLAALAPAGVLKCDHFLHLRCELPAPDMAGLLAEVAEHPSLRLASLMDHAPGVGQFVDMDRYRGMKQREGMEEVEVEAHIDAMTTLRAENAARNRAALLEMLGGRVPLAAHDDWSAAEVARNHADGIGISEFPVNHEAARAARAHGMDIIVGAPNLVRGGSHSGNVAAIDLVREGLVDCIASDYVPPAMLEAAWRLGTEEDIGLPAAIALVTANPARMARLEDRGRLEPGLRGDLVRVRPLPASLTGTPLPMVRSVWLAGERIA